MRYDRNSIASKLILTEVNTFKILPEEEQRDLIREYQATGNNKCMDKVLKSNMKYFIGAIMKFSRGRITTSHPMFLEVLQESLLNIFRVVGNKYDPNKSCIRVYANQSIRNAISKYMSQLKRNQETRSSEDVEYVGTHNPFPRVDLFNDINKSMDGVDKDASVFYGCHLEQKTMIEVGDELGISTYRVKQRKNRAKEKAKQALKG